MEKVREWKVRHIDALVWLLAVPETQDQTLEDLAISQKRIATSFQANLIHIA